MRKITLTIAALALATWATAQPAQNHDFIPLMNAYDIDDTSYLYVATFGGTGAGTATGSWRQGPSQIETSGSSTTVTAVLATGIQPFNTVAVGDALWITYQGVTYYRWVTARASASSITVDTAIDLTSNASFQYRTRVIAGAATDGMISVEGYKSFGFQFALTTLVSTSVESRVECRPRGSTTWTVVVPSSGTATSQTAVGSVWYQVWVNTYDICRLGFKVTADGGTDAVSAYFVGVR